MELNSIQIGITERGDAVVDLSWRQHLINGGYAILITKNAKKLFKIIYNDIRNKLYSPKHIIVHATVTSYAKTDLEPNVPKYDWFVINNFKYLLGIADFVLRVDPIIPNKIGTEIALNVIKKFTNNIDNHRIRISFIDNYKHIQERGINLDWNTFHASLELRKNSYDKIKKLTDSMRYQLEVCGEPDFQCHGCISIDDLKAFGIDYKNIEFPKNQQRFSCACLGIKKELLNNRHPCKHNCKYCYWKD